MLASYDSGTALSESNNPFNGMILNNSFIFYLLTHWVSLLRGELHNFLDAWQRCSFLKWNNPFALLRLTLYPKNHTLHLVQLRFLE